MLTGIYLALSAAGVIAGYLAKNIGRGRWYLVIGFGAAAFIVHGFVLDPLIGYPPWRDSDSTEIPGNVALSSRIVSWFSYGVVWGCVAGLGQVLREKKNGKA